MVDIKPQVVSTLNEILPTYYELFVDSDTELPCITYRVAEDNTSIHTKEAETSYVRYIVKLWGSSVEELAGYASQVDEAMRQLGFTRFNYNELSTDTQISLIFSYEGLIFEIF